MRYAPTTSETAGLADRVEVSRSGAWTVLNAPTPVESVVSVRGSISTFPRFEAGDVILQDLVVALLDKGTRRRDRFQIAEVLDTTGAQLSIVSDSLRVRFSVKALDRDLPRVMDVLAEQLREPLLDPVEFEKARQYVAAAYQREMENTAAQASASLTRLLYGAEHPNFTMRTEEALSRLAAYSIEDVASFHNRHFGPTDAIVVFCGDLADVRVQQVVADSLADWPAENKSTPLEFPASHVKPGSDHVLMSDRNNSDVRLGHALDVRRQDEDYLPLYAGNYVLGGNFSARLMATIRDRMGLTYGIWSSISGVTTVHSGHWVAGVTLSGENVARGIEATRAEMDRFVGAGVTADELAEKQTTIAGSFKVGLATTGGMAASLLYNAERGFDVDYLDRFPDLIEALDVHRVNDAIRTHLDPSRLSLAIAGP